MRTLQRRLRRLERLASVRPISIPIDLILERAAQSMSSPDLDLLVGFENGMDVEELSDVEADAWLRWRAALNTEARRLGFRSFAWIERITGRTG
jgi:hypothetical protein